MKRGVSDGYASGCIYLFSAVDLWRDVTVGRAVQYEEAMKSWLVVLFMAIGCVIAYKATRD